MGKKYHDLSQLLRAAGGDEELIGKIEEECRHTQLSALLFALRCKAGLTQKELAEKIAVSQSVISRIENARDEELNVEDLLRYAKGLDLQLQIGFNPKTTIVERIRHSLHRLSSELHGLFRMAGDDQALLTGALKVLADTAKNQENTLKSILDYVSPIVREKLEETGDKIATDDFLLTPSGPDEESGCIPKGKDSVCAEQ